MYMYIVTPVGALYYTHTITMYYNTLHTLYHTLYTHTHTVVYITYMYCVPEENDSVNDLD